MESAVLCLEGNARAVSQFVTEENLKPSVSNNSGSETTFLLSAEKNPTSAMV